MSKNSWLALAGGVLVVAVVAALWILYRPTPPQVQCSFTGWQQTLGIALEAKVEQLDALKTTIGVSEAQVRAFDTLMQDYALKYDAACQDASAVPPRMTQAEYACVRRNMEGVLDDLRSFAQAVDAAKSVADAPGQREIILKALENFDAARRSGYKTNCTSAIGVNPNPLSFTGLTPERSIQITNRGNNDFTFAVEQYPQGFEPKPSSGRVDRGDTVAVVLFRTIVPPPQTRPLTFHVRTNFNDDIELEIELDAVNASIWQTIGERAAALSGTATPTLASTIRVVNEVLGSDTRASEADKYIFASNVLFTKNAIPQASIALDTASKLNAATDVQPSVKAMRALISARTAAPEEAVIHYAAAQAARDAAENNDRIVVQPKAGNRNELIEAMRRDRNSSVISN